MTYTCCYCEAESETRQEAIEHECGENPTVHVHESAEEVLE